MVIELLTWRKKFIQEEGGLPPSYTELPCMGWLECVLSNAVGIVMLLRFPSVMGTPPASQAALLNRQYSPRENRQFIILLLYLRK